ncbi:hypothetical protein [Paraliobacillus sediminis]|uniref:hypothetical protein n=1 Tax=Paraliobacillus sediminis TaxID=1885916 RepID=UPI000E3C244D|nr:hypothetical protein [Paraliobacillus sediminis]
MKREKLKVLLAFTAIIPLFLFSYQGQTNGDITTESVTSKELSANQVLKKEEATNVEANRLASSQEDIKTPTLEHNELIDITNTFMDILVQDVDQQYKVNGIETKVELIDKFKDTTTEEIATEYVSHYYEEKEDGLYIIPTETPPWFIESQPYQKESTGENKVKITQQNQSDLYGAYTIEIELTYNEEGWKITNINHNDQNNDTMETNQV